MCRDVHVRRVERQPDQDGERGASSKHRVGAQTGTVVLCDLLRILRCEACSLHCLKSAARLRHGKLSNAPFCSDMIISASAKGGLRCCWRGVSHVPKHRCGIVPTRRIHPD